MLRGFHVRGHSGLDDYGKDVLCAFVSSAVILAANTITEVIGAKAQLTSRDGDVYLLVSDKDKGRCQEVLAGLKLHLEATGEQYEKYLKVTITEV